jgi:hypothetical protein
MFWNKIDKAGKNSPIIKYEYCGSISLTAARGGTQEQIQFISSNFGG